MTDVDKTIKHLKEGIDFAESRGYEGLANTMRDALELLKEQQDKIRVTQLALDIAMKKGIVVKT